MRIERPQIAASLDALVVSSEDEQGDETANIEDIDTDQISSDEWTSSDSDQEDF